MLKSQDIVILLKIFSILSKESEALISQNKLATLLCISVSEVNAGIKRLFVSGLLGSSIKQQGNQIKEMILPIKTACEECLVAAVKYFLPVQIGTYTRGIATSYAAPIFKQHISIGSDPIPVWPHAEGTERGLALEPLYRSIPNSLTQYPDQLFYELLVLVDAIRSGRARERAIAVKLLKEKIDYESKTSTNDIEFSDVRKSSQKVRKA